MEVFLAPYSFSIVKVQVPLQGPFPMFGEHHDLLVYNKTRSFQAMITGTTKEGKELAEIVRSRGINGQKGYFLACMEKEGELTVVTDKLLPTQPW